MFIHLPYFKRISTISLWHGNDSFQTSPAQNFGINKYRFHRICSTNRNLAFPFSSDLLLFLLNLLHSLFTFELVCLPVCLFRFRFNFFVQQKKLNRNSPPRGQCLENLRPTPKWVKDWTRHWRPLADKTFEFSNLEIVSMYSTLTLLQYIQSLFLIFSLNERIEFSKLSILLSSNKWEINRYFHLLWFIVSMYRNRWNIWMSLV